MDTKHCRKCDTTKPVSEFCKQKASADGLQGYCKPCKNGYASARYNPTGKPRGRPHTIIQFDHLPKLERAKAINKEAKHQWYLRNKDRQAANVRRREAAKLHRTPAWLTNTDHEAIVAIYKDRDELTALTGIQFHVDHVLPLQGELVSGLHVPANLAVIPYYENLSKSNQYDV